MIGPKSHIWLVAEPRFERMYCSSRGHALNCCTTAASVHEKEHQKVCKHGYAHIDRLMKTICNDASEWI